MRRHRQLTRRHPQKINPLLRVAYRTHEPGSKKEVILYSEEAFEDQAWAHFHFTGGIWVATAVKDVPYREMQGVWVAATRVQVRKDQGDDNG